jgi:Sulfotransferase domain
MHTNVSTPTIQSDQGILDPLTMRARTVAHMGTVEKLYRGITSSIRVLPDFLIIGTQRGGTTALYHYLKTHPCIIPATIGDTHFFDKKYSKGLRWYQAHFPTLWEKAYAQQVRKRPLVTGEASSSYLFYPLAPKRVAESLPHVKLMVLLRNPVDRAYSQYYHAVELKHETLPFEEAIQDEEKRTAQEHEKILQDEQYESHTYTHRSYLTRGIYMDQLQAWMTLFPREQFLILKSEDFYTDPVATFTQVSAFLNLPPAKPRLNKKDYKQYSHNTYFATMDPAMRTRLIEYFKPHNARLYEYLGIDFGWDK